MTMRSSPAWRVRAVAKGISLAEILITLAVLGVIATLTIPKVLQNQTNPQYSAAAKEAAVTIVDAYNTYQLDKVPTSALTAKDLTPFLNYVKADTTGKIEDPDGNQVSCTNTSRCYQLHNGGKLYPFAMSFGGTATTNAIWFLFDPDGKVTGNAGGYGVNLALYYQGRVSSHGNITAGTVSSDLTRGPWKDPVWFHWD